MNRIFLVVFTMVVFSGLASCNTINGMGKDIERAGQTISSASKDKLN